MKGNRHDRFEITTGSSVLSMDGVRQGAILHECRYEERPPSAGG
jgi:hypothetical protein